MPRYTFTLWNFLLIILLVGCEISTVKPTSPPTIAPTSTSTPIVIERTGMWPKNFSDLTLYYSATFSAGDPARGANLNVSYGCTGCHGIPNDPSTAVVGPHYNDLTENARLAGYGTDVAQYVYESILYPNDFIPPDCPHGSCGTPSAMPSNFPERMATNPQDIMDIVVYWLAPFEVTPIPTATKAPTPTVDTSTLENHPDTAPVDIAGWPSLARDLPRGNRIDGRMAFERLGCQGCHSLDGSIGIGPSVLQFVALHPDYDEAPDIREQMLYHAILQPNNVIRPGYALNIMPLNYDDSVTEQEMADLLRYLTSLAE